MEKIYTTADVEKVLDAKAESAEIARAEAILRLERCKQVYYACEAMKDVDRWEKALEKEDLSLKSRELMTSKLKQAQARKEEAFSKKGAADYALRIAFSKVFPRYRNWEKYSTPEEHYYIEQQYEELKAEREKED